MSGSTPALSAVRCNGCGGAVAMEVGRTVPSCVFCGREDLSPMDLPESVEPPVSYQAFEIDRSGATGVFNQFVRSSIWYPRDLAKAVLDAHPVFLPAWLWSARMETHYTALVRAGTRSGKRPISGQETAQVRGVLVPASSTLRPGELDALSPFHLRREIPFDAASMPGPFEVGELTRTGAWSRAEPRLRRLAEDRIGKRVGSSRLHGSHLAHDRQGRPVLLPVWIGAYRHEGRLYRVVINGQTGLVSGDAPISKTKVILAVLAGLAFAVILLIVLAGSNAI